MEWVCDEQKLFLSKRKLSHFLSCCADKEKQFYHNFYYGTSGVGEDSSPISSFQSLSSFRIIALKQLA